jgi:subtilisin family serine protease
LPDHIEPLRDDPFPPLTAVADPALSLVAWLIRNRDRRQLEQRTGILQRPGSSGGKHKEPKYRLHVLVERKGLHVQQISEDLHKKYQIPLAYRRENKDNQALTHATAGLPLNDEIFNGSINMLLEGVHELRGLGVTRFCLGAPGQPSRERPSRGEIGLPPTRDYKGRVLTGHETIIGIIDDGCAFAHPDFLKKGAGARAQSRILHLWDQGSEDTSAPWVEPPGFYGRELNQAAIDNVLNLHKNGSLLREDLIYKDLGYAIDEVSPHGTHVMDIAAGGGQSPMSAEGVAPEADIIFVQLPKAAIEQGATVLWRHIVDGVQYIFERARTAAKSGRPAVVNISYGGYDGPHDGTSEIEKVLDELLEERDRAVVIAAGNGFEQDCHAVTVVPREGLQSLRWIVQPEDPTANDLEAWYDDKSTVHVRLRAPGIAIDPGGFVQLGQTRTEIKRPDGKTIGYIEHRASTTGNSSNRIVVSLNATDAAAENGNNAPAPPGLWHVDFMHASGPQAEVHAWIWRDDAGRAANARRRQSRFHPDDAHPAHTIAGWATGKLTISVGAFNAATGEICRYSACGPTRHSRGNPSDPKPEVYAPAEDDVRGRGILSASALSARPRRMNGTSAAAPHVTGLIALAFEYATKHAGKHLTAKKIREELKAGAGAPAGLLFNRRQAADDRVIVKQAQVRGDLVDSGKTHFIDTMKKLLP